MKRLFLSIPFTSKINHAILQKLKLFPEYKWIASENLHLTVHFIGETRAEDIALITRKVIAITHYIPPFDLVFKETKVVLNSNRGPMIWLTFKEVEPLNTMANLISEVLSNSPEHHFYPHITLLRMSEQKGNDIIAKQLVNRLQIEPFSISVRQIELWESIQTEQGRKYLSLVKFELKG